MQPSLPARPIIGFRALSKETQVNIGTLRSAASDGRLPLRRFQAGGQIAFDAEEVEQWIKSGASLRSRVSLSC